MASDGLTTPLDGWEKAANALLTFGSGLVIFPYFMLWNVLGWIGALLVALLFSLVVSALVRRQGRRSRSRRVAADTKRGVAKVFFRFGSGNIGRTQNYGWREGVLLLNEGGMSFRQLRGPGGPVVGQDIALVGVRVLGQHDIEPPLVPGLTTDMKAFTLSTEGRECEVALHAGYLKHQRFKDLFDVGGRV